MIKVAQKKNLSSMQVLKTLRILLQGDFSMQELLSKLNGAENAMIFNHSVVSKYINTCRCCGIDIQKIHNKYFVAGMPFGLELTGEDINLLEKLANIVKDGMTKKCNKIFNNFIEKLNRFSNKDITRVEKETYHVFTELFERAINEKRKICLMFKNKASFECIPLNITENKDKIFFHIMDINTDEDKIIESEKISGLEVLNERYARNYTGQVVVFELKAPLAQRYYLHEKERLTKPFDGKSIIVSNYGEEKEILLSRLMRYDDKCKILNPASYKEEMVKMIEDTLENYR